MAELKILTCPAPTLFRRARAVSRVSLRVRCLAHDMLATMYAASGVGLAAPQVGVGKRLIVVDVGLPPIVLVNPEIRSTEGEQVGLEGCLSLPDLVGEVRRATERLLEGMTADGGGYILAASHVVPPETPLENVFAMYEVAGVSRDEIEDRAADIRAEMVLSGSTPLPS